MAAFFCAISYLDTAVIDGDIDYNPAEQAEVARGMAKEKRPNNRCPIFAPFLPRNRCRPKVEARQNSLVIDKKCLPDIFLYPGFESLRLG